MNFEEAKDIVRSLGYDLHSTSGDRTWLMAIKDLPLVNDSIAIEIDLVKKQCKIKTVIGLCNISTSWIQFPHPNFILFEKQLINILIKVHA